MKKLIVAVLLGCISTAAQASDWWMLLRPIGAKPNRIAFFADKASVQDIKGFKRVWLGVVYENPEAVKESARSLAQFDCHQQRHMMLQQSTLLPSGQLQSRTPPAVWTFIAPDTPMRIIADNVCQSPLWHDGIRFNVTTPEDIAESLFSAAN